MADPKAIEFLEDVYARVDKQVREIVASMLPGMTISAQDDGAVVANDHRILNFQGPVVAVSDEPARRRVNVYVPGAPVSSATTTVVSSTSAKVFNLWSGSANTAPPANWQTLGFDDSAWSAAVSANRGTGMGAPTGATAIWTSSSPASSTQEILTRQTFTLPAGTVSSATLILSADDQINAIYVNGTLLGFSGPPGYGPPSYSTTTLNVPVALLNAGTNLLAVWGKNFDPSVSGTTTLSWNYTITGSEVIGSPYTPWFTAALPAFSGAYSISLHASPGSPQGTNVFFHFRRSGDTNLCYSAYWSLLTGGTDSSSSGTVGVPTSVWHCYDWDTLEIGYHSSDLNRNRLSIGTVVTVTLTASSLPAGSNAWLGYRLDVGTSAAGTDSQYIPKSVVTAKGDVIVGASSANPVRLGAGSDGQVLTARAAAINGVQWETGSGGGGTPALKTAHVHRSTQQLISTTAAQAVSFDVLDYDTDSMWNASTPTRLTCQTAGKYLCTAQLAWTANTNAMRGVLIEVNGVIVAGGKQQPNPSSPEETLINCSWQGSMAMNDYVEMFARQNTGSTLNTSITAPGCHLTLTLLGT